QLNLGEGNDRVIVEGTFSDSTGTNFTQFNGNFSLTEGNGDDLFAIVSISGAGTTIAGNATFQFGSGNDSFSTAGGLSVFGNMSLSMGDGDDLADLFGATMAGSLTINLGNGTDVGFVGNPPAGQFRYHSGNGNDSLTLAPDVDGVWNVLMTFGTGNDT